MKVLSVILLVLGIISVLGTVVWGIFARKTTPNHLRGYYGVRYLIFAVLAVVCGIALIVSAFLI